MLLTICVAVVAFVINTLHKEELRKTMRGYNNINGTGKPLKKLIYKFDADGDLVYTNNPDRKHLEVRK